MSKYDPLWAYVKEKDEYYLEVTFDEAQKVLGFPIKSSVFANKAELAGYGYEIAKMLKEEKIIIFRKID